MDARLGTWIPWIVARLEAAVRWLAAQGLDEQVATAVVGAVLLLGAVAALLAVVTLAFRPRRPRRADPRRIAGQLGAVATHAVIGQAVSADAYAVTAISGSARALLRQPTATSGYRVLPVRAGPSRLRDLSEDELWALLQLCDTSPNEALTRIDSYPDAYGPDPLPRFLRLAAYRRLIYGSLEQARQVTGDGAEPGRFQVEITEEKIRWAMSALNEIRQIEQVDPAYFRHGEADQIAAGSAYEGIGPQFLVDAIAHFIEGPRPGAVQQVLGWTKLAYFGPRLWWLNAARRDIADSLSQVRFAATRIALTAFPTDPPQPYGQRGLGMSYILCQRPAVELPGSLDELEPFGILILCLDGSWRFDDVDGQSLGAEGWHEL